MRHNCVLVPGWCAGEESKSPCGVAGYNLHTPRQRAGKNNALTNDLSWSDHAIGVWHYNYNTRYLVALVSQVENEGGKQVQLEPHKITDYTSDNGDPVFKEH